MTIPVCPGPVRATKTPAYRPPPNATDTHAHIFGPVGRFPYAAERTYTPEECTTDDYRRMLATIGFSRAALVQGGAHGTDNRAILDAIAQRPANYRGVVVIPPGQSQSDLAALDAAGIRGVRLSTMSGSGVDFSHLERLAGEIGDLGWHVLLHFKDPTELLEVASTLRRLRIPFVLDHIARISAAGGVTSDPFRTLMALLDTGRCYVKFASLYRLSSEPYPHNDLLPMIRAIVSARPDRIIWGSNWPHPIHYHGVMPDDGDLVDLIPLWVPDPADQVRMLVTNPDALYRFSDSPRGSVTI
jgi:predicted TIM-barrel fold metal-dependent hydrolase